MANYAFPSYGSNPWDTFGRSWVTQPSTATGTSGGTFASAGSGFDQYNQYILSAANKYGVDPAYIKAVMQVESGGDPNAVSSAGARGLMQIMPNIWATHGENLFDPATNIDMGTRILKSYYDQNNGDWANALAAYNGTKGTAAGTRYSGLVLGALPKYQTSGGTTGGTTSGGTGNVSSVLQRAAAQVGKPYVLGSSSTGANPGSFDCSSLVQWSYGQSGIQLPRTAAQQYNATQRVDKSQLQPGDLVFFSGTDGRAGITHVGIYQGNGMMINAVSEGKGIQIQNINSPYWTSHYAGGGRVSGATGTVGTAGAPAAAPQKSRMFEGVLAGLQYSPFAQRNPDLYRV